MHDRKSPIAFFDRHVYSFLTRFFRTSHPNVSAVPTPWVPTIPLLSHARGGVCCSTYKAITNHAWDSPLMKASNSLLSRSLFLRFKPQTTFSPTHRPHLTSRSRGTDIHRHPTQITYQVSHQCGGQGHVRAAGQRRARRAAAPTKQHRRFRPGRNDSEEARK